MTIWDYLDKHEIIGTCLVFALALIAAQAAATILIAWAQAWGKRVRATRVQGVTSEKED